MKNETKGAIWITSLIVLLVGGVFVGGVYFNIPVGAFPPILTILSLILIGVDRIFFKKKRDLGPLPEPSKETKLRVALAAYAGLSLFAIILGICIGLNILSYLEKKGIGSVYEVMAVLIGVPVVVIIYYLKKRSDTFKKYA